MPKKHKSGRKSAARSPEAVRGGRVQRIERWGDDIDPNEKTFDAFELQKDRISVDLEETARARLENAEALGLGDEVIALKLPTRNLESEVDEEQDVEDEGIASEPTTGRKPTGDRVPSDFRPLTSANKGRFARHPDRSWEIVEEVVPAPRQPTADIRGAYHVGRNEDDEPDSSDEEAVALNLAETRQLQRVAREALVEEDFGIPEADTQPVERLDEALLPLSGRPDPPALVFQSRDHAIAHLLNTSPEILSLVDDFASCSHRLAAFEADLLRKEQSLPKGHAAVALASLYHNSLSIYLTVSAFYFRLLSLPSTAESLKVKVLTRLTGLRQAVASLDEQGVGDPEAVASTLFVPDEDMEEEYTEEDDEELEELIQQLESEGIRIEDLADGQLASLIEEFQSVRKGEPAIVTDDAPSKSSTKKAPSQKPRPKQVPDGDQPSVRKRKRREEANIAAPELPPLPSRLPHTAELNEFTDAADFLDPTSLSAIDVAEKAKSKHDLRFHVRRAEQTAARRAAARVARTLGGDEDVPYRSKERSRSAVRAREQAKANKAAGLVGQGVALDEDDWGEADWGAAEGVKESHSASNAERDAQGYYDLVKRRKFDQAAQRQADYDNAREAGLEEVAEALRAGGSTGPRAISRAISANKGLTPKRNKANRNPRVKKKLRYDKAKKKVASSGRTAFAGRPSVYTGEKSGISRSTVKSVKLGSR